MDKIQAQHLMVNYDHKTILQDLNLAIPAGKITAIIGPNGCGKSTLLKSLGKILPLKKGHIFLDKTDIQSFTTKELAAKLAHLPQSPLAPDGITVEEIVSYGRFPYQKGIGKLSAEDQRMIQWALAATGMTDFAESGIEELSGGQRQRVWIAMALAQDTDVILLDEPTTYLDIAYQLEILELLAKLNTEQNRTIIMVLHDLNLAARYADYLTAIVNGEVRAFGSVQEVMTEQVLADVFRIKARIVTDPDTGKPTCLSYQLIK